MSVEVSVMFGSCEPGGGAKQMDEGCPLETLGTLGTLGTLET